MEANAPLFTAIIAGRVGIKKNSTQRRFSFSRQRTITMPSDRYLLWARHALLTIKQAWLGREPINEPISVFFEFDFKTKQAEPDTSNCVEGPADILQQAGVISDDKNFYFLAALKTVRAQHDETRITIFKFNLENINQIKRSVCAIQ